MALHRRHLRLKREAALKILAAKFIHDAKRLRRFEQEAQTTSALNQPNIATIYESTLRMAQA